MKQRRFLVALSFPGERRDFVAGVASTLGARLGRDKVLYDEFHEAELARLDLDVYLGQLYREESHLLVPFYCVDYDRKKWCKLEWRQMRDILLNLEGHRIMPFRFDDAPVAGVLSLDGYIKIGSRSPQVIAELILQRLSIDENESSQSPVKTSRQPSLDHASAPPMPSVQEVISGTQRASPTTSSVMPTFYLFASPSGAPEKSSVSSFTK
jgi:hypothetical protein